MATKPSKLWIRDPKRPKLPLNSFVLYYLEKRPSMAQKFPEKDMIELTKATATQWNGLPAETKAPYVERSQLGKQRYERRMTRYREPSQETLKTKYGRLPKRFANPYCYFVQRNFNVVSRRFPDFSFARVSRLLAKMWAGTGKDRDKSVGRKEFKDRYKTDRRRWKQEMHLYRTGHFHHGVRSGCMCHRPAGRPVRPNKGGIVRCRKI